MEFVSSPLSQPISLVIADDEERFLELLELFFRKRPEFEVAGVARDGADALKVTSAVKPDFLVCDITMPLLTGLEVTEKVVQGGLKTQVVLMTGRSLEESARQSLMAGARAFVAKPFRLEELAEQLLELQSARVERKEALKQRESKPPQESSRVLTFFAPKGGSGASSLAVCIGLELVRSGCHVCLIDLNLQWGDVEFLLDLRGQKCLTDAVGEKNTLSGDSIYVGGERHASGLRVLYQHRLEESDKLIAEHVELLLGKQTQEFDFVVVDLPKELDDRSLTAMEMADTLFVVTTPDDLSVRSARRALDLFGELQGFQNKVRVLMNRVQGGVDERLVGHLRARPYAELPDSPREFQEAVRTGLPVVLGSPNSRFAAAIGRFVSSAILLRAEGSEPGFLKRLFSGG